MEGLRDPLRAVALGVRPKPGNFREAARARRPIYRLALDAYALLQGIEIGDEAAMMTIAKSALLAPIEDWRQFELAVALGISDALGKGINGDVTIRILGASSKEPIITVGGRFDIYWQQLTKFYKAPPLEPSESATSEILNAYGFNFGVDRPDLIVVDRQTDQVAAIVEAKYLLGDTMAARFRDAVEQVVRYARGY